MRFLQKALNDLGLSLTEFSRGIDVSVSHLAKYMQFKNNLSRDIQDRIFEMFNLPRDLLFEDILPPVKEIRNCLYCNKRLTRRVWYCSKECRDEARRVTHKWSNQVCESCGELMKPVRYKNGGYYFRNRKYCSRSCFHTTTTKSVIQCSKIGEFIAMFHSVKEAGNSLGREKVNPSNIISCCRGRTKTAYGFKWSYLE